MLMLLLSDCKELTIDKSNKISDLKTFILKFKKSGTKEYILYDYICV